MKDLLSTPAQFRTIEFRVATAFYVFAVFFLVGNVVSGEGPEQVTQGYLQYHFLPLLFRYSILYGTFLLLNHLIAPRVAENRDRPLYIAAGILLVIVAGAGIGATETWLRPQTALNNTPRISRPAIFRESYFYVVWMALVFGFYTFLKYASLRILAEPGGLRRRYPFWRPELITALLLWATSMFFVALLIGDRDVVAFWAAVPLAAIMLYGAAVHWLIPRALQQRRGYLRYQIRAMGLLALSIFPVGVVVEGISRDEDLAVTVALLAAFFHAIVTTPFIWFLYRRQARGAAVMQALEEEIGRSHASLDFLRSQINPHFLFNALNTIYGTALQEGAERTGEGIERLSSMMRFMLQENLQETIPLQREIEYLLNYIALQRLRVAGTPTVQIDTHLEEVTDNPGIAPMLLIPFVENAFKHGVSLRAPSFIRISLGLEGRTLQFDVQNSRHVRAETDPERNNNGIGLANVRQRLQMLYPGRHELLIRETAREFFVHLTVQLS